MAKSEFSYSLSLFVCQLINTCDLWVLTADCDSSLWLGVYHCKSHHQLPPTERQYSGTIWKMLYYYTLYVYSNKWDTYAHQERGWQTDSRACLFAAIHTRRRTHTYTKRGVWAWAIVLAMHKQEDSQTGRRTERQTNGRQAGRHIKWVMKCWQDILLYTHTQTHTHVHKSCECPLRPATVAGAFGVH